MGAEVIQQGKRLYWKLRSSRPVTALYDHLSLLAESANTWFTPSLERVDVPADLGQRAFQHVRHVVEFGPRHPNSDGWQRQLEYVCSTLIDIGLTPARDRWHDPEERLDFENISVRIPGERPERIVLAAHHDTKRFEGHPDPKQNFHFVGANDGGSGVGLLLALAAELKGRDNRATIEIVFFDGEESITVDWNNARRALFGSRRFVQKARQHISSDDVAPIVAMLLVDMVGADPLRIDDERCSDRGLKRLLRRAAVDRGLGRHFFHQRATVADDHLPFIDAGIPAVDLVQRNHNPYWHTPYDTLDHISAKSLHMVGEVILTALPAIETHCLS